MKKTTTPNYLTPAEPELRFVRQVDYLLPVGDDAVIGWLKARKFNGSEAESAIEFAKNEEGDARTLWQIVQGLTASAREYAFIDARQDLEKRAGALLKIVAGE